MHRSPTESEAYSFSLDDSAAVGLVLGRPEAAFERSSRPARFATRVGHGTNGVRHRCEEVCLEGKLRDHAAGIGVAALCAIAQQAEGRQRVIGVEFSQHLGQDSRPHGPLRQSANAALDAPNPICSIRRTGLWGSHDPMVALFDVVQHHSAAKFRLKPRALGWHQHVRIRHVKELIHARWVEVEGHHGIAAINTLESALCPRMPPTN